MSNLPSPLLTPHNLKTTFVEQLSILYSAKNHLIKSLPGLIEQSCFKNLKLALQEDLEDTEKEMTNLKSIFKELNASALTENLLGMDAIITEAHKQVFYNKSNHFESDMSIIFYMSVIENLQLGAGRILNGIVVKLPFKLHAQLITQTLNVNKG